MTEPISGEEARRLRARLDQIAPEPNAGMPQSFGPAPDSWQGRLCAKHEEQRQERLAAAKVVAEEAIAAEAAKQAKRKAIDREIAELETRRKPIDEEHEKALLPLKAEYWRATAPLELEYQRQVAPLDEAIGHLQAERKVLE
jgi:hypothetical protein